MDRNFAGLAEGQARIYFLDLVACLRDLGAAHAQLVAAMTCLLQEYDQAVPRCKLRLYPRKRPGSFGPTALHWGTLFRLHPSSTGKGRRLPTKAIHHLKGTFDPGWVYTFAKRSDLKERFLDFDRRRLALNAASRSVYRTLRIVKKAVVLKDSLGVPSIFVESGLDPGAQREVPELPEELLPRDFLPHLRAALRAGWVHSFSLAFYEEELCDLGSEVQGNQSLDGLRLLLERPRGSFYRRAVWSHAPAGNTTPKMTDRLMRELRVKLGARPVLALKELKRKRISRLQETAGKALLSIRESCTVAQVEVAKGLAQVMA